MDYLCNFIITIFYFILYYYYYLLKLIALHMIIVYKNKYQQIIS